MYFKENTRCKVREVVINNKCVVYTYSIKVNKCNGNCNNISNSYSRVCVPNIVKNITVKVFDLMSLKNKTKQIKRHEGGKCVCRLDPIICNNKRQKWNKDKCRCECLINKKCGNKFWNPNSCKCEYKKKPAHLLTEECEEIIVNKTLSTKENVSIKKYNETVSIKENIPLDSCKPFVPSFILFLSVSIIITRLFVYFYVNLQSKRKLHDCY